MKRTAACSGIIAALLGVATFWPSARIPGVASVHARLHGCSNASLRGTYAFQRTGVNQDWVVRSRLSESSPSMGKGTPSPAVRRQAEME